MLNFKFSHRKKNIDFADEEQKSASVRREHSVISTKSKFECFLEQQTRRRSLQSSWCRACFSEDCCLGREIQHLSSKDAKEVIDQEINVKLKSIKQRRLATEDYIEHVGKLSAVCKLGLLLQPYLPSQQHLPPWMLDVAEREFVIPLVPTFPASREALEKLVSELDLNQPTHSILQDYEEAHSWVRRVRVKCLSGHISISSPIPDFVVCEDIIDRSLLFGTEAKTEKSEGNVKASPNSKTTSINSLSSKFSAERLTQNEHIETREGIKGNWQAWNILYVCSKAIVKECRDERAVITGLFPEKILGDLEFKLLLFPGERTNEMSMKLKGTFLRKAGRSGYNLRWKFDVDVPAAPSYS